VSETNLQGFYNVKRSRSRRKTQGLVIIKPSISAIAPSSEGGCLSSAMLRAKIDLRQPMFLLKFTEDRDCFKQGSRNTRFPRFRIQDRKHHQWRSRLTPDGDARSYSVPPPKALY